MKELDDLIAALARLGELSLAHTPEEALADDALQSEVTAFLKDYPFLERDAGYVAYLRRYAGALVVRDADGYVLSLFGFSHDIGMHLVEGPGELIEKGRLVFADMIVPIDPGDSMKTIGVGFGFEATGGRRSGIYRVINTGEPEWFSETFLEWLRRVVASDGRLID